MKAVYVDMGETLVSFKPRYHYPIYSKLREMGYDVTERQVFRAVSRQLGSRYFPNMDGLSELDYWELLTDMRILPRREVVQELEKLNLLSNSYELFPDSIDFLNYVRKRGARVIMVTNATSSFKRIVKSLGLEEHLDGIVASCEVGYMKPHPRIFRKAVDVGGEGIFIGDVYEIDYVGALRAGLTPILIDRENYYEDLNVRKVRDLSEAKELVDEMLKE
ncbi:2-haloalkanoic acid dehalogenase [Sulfodiicoccus acidiphilus]|uniref:2-haloalkanoic acid dehalogenase n=1 Tax=Sulfodiicoccus acidiphilus TaxID=1670455 RepID=A0A348B2J3_9CREN|nr:HAD-IA family hydrolase [Sulfodiicoccus acidiphilus]BBD72395.1 2-haloalkanoic acid dehalogenase [Sulfodiicoccus acidiphilus]GGT97432.1 2-haloalkanoic acid dehalogenase [Sulfodiicoccus acidiphilus]